MVSHISRSASKRSYKNEQIYLLSLTVIEFSMEQCILHTLRKIIEGSSEEVKKKKFSQKKTFEIVIAT
jgi:hypothetical protein